MQVAFCQSLKGAWRLFDRARSRELEAAIGIEPMMKVLQTSALPLGYAALDAEGGDDGAGNGIRTRDFNLGKVALYH